MARASLFFTLGRLIPFLFVVATAGPAHSAEGPVTEPTDQRKCDPRFRWRCIPDRSATMDEQLAGWCYGGYKWRCLPPLETEIEKASGGALAVEAVPRQSEFPATRRQDAAG